jgi:hypothetical protein
VSDNVRIETERKASPNLRKLARALLLLAELQAAKDAGKDGEQESAA